MGLKRKCIRVKESSESKMSVKTCDMIYKCGCEKPGCCVPGKGRKNELVQKEM